MHGPHRPPCEAGQVQSVAGKGGDLSPGLKRWILVATALGSALTFIDGSAVLVAVLGTPDARDLPGAVMAGSEAGPAAPAAIAAFHTVFRAVMGLCAVCAVLAGIIGMLTAPGRAQSAA